MLADAGINRKMGPGSAPGGSLMIGIGIMVKLIPGSVPGELSPRRTVAE